MDKVNDKLLKDINSRFSQLKSDRNKFEDRWKTAQEFVDDTVVSWGSLDTVPSVPNRYSSIPCNYLKTLVNGLIGYSISPNIVWFKLSLENQKALKLYRVKDWLEDVERVMLTEFNRSNLYSQAVRFISDAAILGHGVLLCDEDIKQDRLRFTKLPANEIYLDVNSNGEIDTVFREFVITVRNAVKFFGLENLDERIQEDYKDISKWNNKITVLEAVYPREERNEDFEDAKNKEYAAVFVDMTNNKIISEGGYDDFPFAVFEWEQFSGYAYSSSPAQAAIADIKGLNIAKKTSWQIAQTSAEPPMKVSEDIRNINIVPRGFTYLTSADQIVEPIRTGDNYPITLQVLQDMKQDIKDWFYVDFFLMLQQKQGQMTATEVMELQGEKAATLSNLIVNLNESLQKIIQRSFNILARNGKIPPPPDSLSEVPTQMKVDFVGPLVQAQKKYHTMGGTAQALQMAGPIMNLFPNAGDYIDGDELMKSALEGQGMPQNVIREEKDVQKIRETRAQQQEMLNNIMGNANKLNEPVRQGSTLGAINEQLAGSMR